MQISCFSSSRRLVVNGHLSYRFFDNTESERYLSETVFYADRMIRVARLRSRANRRRLYNRPDLEDTSASIMNQDFAVPEVKDSSVVLIETLILRHHLEK